MSDESIIVTVADIAKLSSGKNAPKSLRDDAGEFPMYGANGLIGHTLQSLHMGPLIAVGRVGSYGSVHRINDEHCWISDNALVALPRSESVTLDFLALVFESIDYETIKSGTTQPLITQSALGRIEVLLPPIPMQRRIVDLMTYLDAHIANLQAEREALRVTQSVALDNAMKGELVETPISEDWVETTLGALAHWRGGMTPSMANPDYWVAGDIPWISSKEVTGTELVSTDKKVTFTALKETSLRLIEAGSTVIVVRSGILLHTLPAAYVPFATTVNQDIKIGSPIDGTDGLFLTFLIRANAAEILNRYRKTGTTVQSINVPALMGHQVLVPPLLVQKRIASLLTHFINQGNSLDEELDGMKILRSGLLSSLLEESLTIDDAYDNILTKVA